MLRPVTNEARVRHGNQPNHRIITPHIPSRRQFRQPQTPNANPKFSFTDFAMQFAREPGATGAIAPSSKSLAKQVVRLADLPVANSVVELGPGTGVFTEQIIKNLSDDKLFFAIELNQEFVLATKQRCPSACVYHDAASALPKWLDRNNRRQVDCVISSLPWTIFDESAQDDILNAITESLKPGGVFVSIIYLGARFRSRGRYFINSLEDHFSAVNCTPTVWQNLPPTQIYRCIK